MLYKREHKVQAIAMIHQEDGVISDALRAQINQRLGFEVPKRTLFYWWNQFKDGVFHVEYSALVGKTDSHGLVAPASESDRLRNKSQSDDRSALTPKLRRVTHKMLDAIESMDATDLKNMKADRLMLTAAIGIDKIMKLEGIPEGVIDIIVRLIALARRKGHSEEEVLLAVCKSLASLPDVNPSTEQHETIDAIGVTVT